MVDTRPEAAAVLRDCIARQTPAQRLTIAVRLSEDVRAIAVAGLKQRYPNEPFLSLIERLIGEPMQPTVRSGPSRTA